MLPKKKFQGGWGEFEGEGRHLFQKEALSPSQAIPMPIRTTRKAGGLLWPYKGLLPAAPKDAGFHAVQAQCPCRLGYPLKGS